MRKLIALVAVFALAAVLADAQPATADRGVSRFATLPAGPGHPEGIAADVAGNIYAASFDFSGVNNIYVFGSNGRLKDTIALNGHVPLGMQFGPDGKLYVADFGNGAVLQLAPPGHAIARRYPVCTSAGTTCGLNGITFDAAGLLYVSDSFGGRVFTVNRASGAVSLYVQHDLLTPGSHGFPGFGANGIAFKGTDLYVANTADDRILKVSATKVVTTFIESINGADGIAWDSSGRLWVCANQENALYVVNGAGRVLDIIGGFEECGTEPHRGSSSQRASLRAAAACTSRMPRSISGTSSPTRNRSPTSPSRAYDSTPQKVTVDLTMRREAAWPSPS